MRNGAESAELYIYDEIDASGYYGISDKDVVAALDTLRGVKRLDVRINSGGGDVFAGMAIYEALRRFPAAVDVYVDGLAASAASVIAMAGSRRYISSGGFFMIHRASGLVYGTDEDMRQMADILSSITDSIANIYVERTGGDLDALREMIAAETWMNASQSIEHNFATSVIVSSDDNDNDKEKMRARITNAQKAFAQSITARAPVLTTPPPDPSGKQDDQPHQPPLRAAFLMRKSQEPQEMSRIVKLQEQFEDLQLKAEEIETKLSEENRDLTSSEAEKLDAIHAEQERVRANLDRLERVEANQKKMLASTGRPTEKAEIDTSTRRASVKTNGGFVNFAEFATDVYRDKIGGRGSGKLIRNVESTYGASGVGADGGFAIPDDYRTTIMSNAIDQDPLLSRCFQVPTTSNRVVLPTHESQPWGTDSLQEYWTGEGSAISRSKFAMNRVEIGVHKIAVLTFVTEELLEDAPALEAAITQDASAKINFALSNALIRGLGVNQPLGILNSPALATVAAESSGGAQTADTIVVENINNMYAAMPSNSMPNAVWLCHPDAQPSIWKAAFHAPSGADPIGRAPGTMPNSPFASLYGRPLIPHQVCETIGDLGDFFFIDFSKYALPIKGGLRGATSMHLAFDQDLMAFKWTLRVGGAPLWKSTVASRDGSFVQSPFIALAAR